MARKTCAESKTAAHPGVAGGGVPGAHLGKAALHGARPT